MDGRHGKLLGEILSTPICPRLEMLYLKDNDDMGDDGMTYVMKGLEVGKCRGLRELDVGNTGMATGAHEAFGRALATGALSQLKRLSLRHNDYLCPEAMVAVLTSLLTCRSLSHLELGSPRLNLGANTAIHDAIRNNNWPCIATMSLEYGNWQYLEGLGDALSLPNSAKCLRSLHLRVYDCSPVATTKNSVKVMEIDGDDDDDNTTTIIITTTSTTTYYYCCCTAHSATSMQP